MNKIINGLEENVENFLKKLSIDNSLYQYRNTLKGNTKNGSNLRLGYSCYALKIYFTLGLWHKLDRESKDEWINYINSFQDSVSRFPANSFIDKALINGYSNFSNYKKLKNLAKLSLNYFNLYNFGGVEGQLNEAIKAESKQAISTLYQIGSKNNKEYSDFEKTEDQVNSYISSLDWGKPWSAGAQYANLCLFTETQLEKNNYQKKVLDKKIKDYLNEENGFYYIGEVPSKSQLVNGAMKVISGLRWIGSPIHYPEKIIDYCLEVEPNQEGCDLVDVVFVLYEASKETNYKKSEIIKYFESMYEVIFSHFYPQEGGFSYYSGKSQIYYYGLRTSKGKSSPDIHGTILLTWALAMIFEVTENENYNWNILKP